jgi:hypothetical protein
MTSAAIEQLTGALEGLLLAKNAEGDSLLCDEHREFIRGDERSPSLVDRTH